VASMHKLVEACGNNGSLVFHLETTRERAKGEVRQSEGGVGIVFPSSSRRKRRCGAPRARG
jgi:hypothetical protein